MTGRRADLEEIRRGLEVLVTPRTVVELRAPKSSQRGTLSGYFSDMEALAEAAALLSGDAPGIYVTLNPCLPATLFRAVNRVKPFAETTTADPDVVARRRLLLDFDPVRPKGVSATDAEVRAALARREEVIGWLLTQGGWPEPARIMSGNGGHAIYCCELHATEDVTRLVEQALRALATRFDDGAVTVDRTVSNLSRITKLPGTLARKGDASAERPHRLAEVESRPEQRVPVSVQALRWLADQAPAHRTYSTSQGPADPGTKPDVLEVCQARGLYLYPLDDHKHAVRCPWSDKHSVNSGPTETVIFAPAEPGSPWGFKCLHAHCADRTIRDVLEWLGLRAAAAWEPPIPLTAVAVPPFPLECLPVWARVWVEGVATALQVAPDLPALVGLAVVAVAVARNVAVLIEPGYVEPVNIFTVVVLPPGEGKSPAFREATAPLIAWEERRGERLRPLIREAQTAKDILEARLRKLTGVAADDTDPEAMEAARKAQECAQELTALRVPVMPRLMADDVTPERLATLLALHGGRMGVLSSEGGVFGLMAGRYARNGAPNFDVFLKGHAGDPLRVDRGSRPDEFVPSPALTLGLTIQPAVLRGLTTVPDFRGRGLLGRFFYAVPSSRVGYRNTAAPQMPEPTRAAYADHIQALLEREPASDPRGDPTPHLIPLAADALARWRAFKAALEPTLRPTGELGALTDWASKLPGGIARIAGLLHMMRRAFIPAPEADAIDGDTMAAAIRIGEYLKPHARLAFQEMGADPTMGAAQKVLIWLEEKGLSTFSIRDLYRGLPGFFRTAADTKPALAVLEAHGYLRLLPSDQQGAGRHRSPRFEVNPLSQNGHNRQNPADPGTRGADAGASGDSGDCGVEGPGGSHPETPLPHGETCDCRQCLPDGPDQDVGEVAPS